MGAWGGQPSSYGCLIYEALHLGQTESASGPFSGRRNLICDGIDAVRYAELTHDFDNMWCGQILELDD